MVETLKPCHPCERLFPLEHCQALIKYVDSITSKTGIKSNIKPPPPPETVILNSHTFDDIALVNRLCRQVLLRI